MDIDTRARPIDAVLTLVGSLKQDLSELREDVRSIGERFDSFRLRCDDRHAMISNEIASLLARQSHHNGVSETLQKTKERQLNEDYVWWIKITPIAAAATLIVVETVRYIVGRIH